MITKEEEKQIKYHYEIALELIMINQMNKAKYELYNKMNAQLYDISLDLMDNRNMNAIKAKDLKGLIIEVHEMIAEYKEEDDSELNDNFNQMY